VVCERPRLEPYVLAMTERLGGALRVAVQRVSVKATTNEEMGAIGRGEGIAAWAVAQLERTPPSGEG
jgi:2-C-methyl-D-erythritol 2,4-cyclodiphosphate synthase